MSPYRIGVDFGGTKVEIAVFDPRGVIVMRRRIPTPDAGGQAQYEAMIATLTALIRAAEAEAALGQNVPVGIGIPGVIDPATGLVKNANSITLNGHPFDRDISAALGRTVRVANDANCFTLSEAVDGAAAGCRVVFGVILGTGVGGGIVVDKQVIVGRHGVTGEWGHNPLPWPDPAERAGPLCWCGKQGCLETFLSGPSLARDCDGPGHHDATALPARAASGDPATAAALARHTDRLARGLAHVIHLLDPDAIVLGGGLSNMAHLYTDLPAALGRYGLGGQMTTPILRNAHGDSSGVRGAAWLWPEAEG